MLIFIEGPHLSSEVLSLNLLGSVHVFWAGFDCPHLLKSSCQYSYFVQFGQSHFILLVQPSWKKKSRLLDMEDFPAMD